MLQLHEAVHLLDHVAMMQRAISPECAIKCAMTVLIATLALTLHGCRRTPASHNPSHVGLSFSAKLIQYLHIKIKMLHYFYITDSKFELNVRTT